MLGTLGPIEHQSFDAWLSLLRVNLAAPMGLTRALVAAVSPARRTPSVRSRSTIAVSRRARTGAATA